MRYITEVEDLDFSVHARDRMREYGIREEWVRRTREQPDETREKADEDGNNHYWKAIEEFEGRAIRAVVNPYRIPRRVVTVHPDRNMTRHLRRQ